MKDCSNCKYWRQSSPASGVCCFDEITRTETAASFLCADHKSGEDDSE